MIRLLYSVMLLTAAALAWLHPGLAAIRIGLAVAYAIPALVLFPGVWRGAPRSLANSCFFSILLAMPLIAEAWSEPKIRLPALLALGLTSAYLALAMLRIRQSGNNSEAQT
ncbi:MAG: hypothetical protein Tsb002_19570 [Wenzhouxiangellaceae bacterium]